MRLPKSSCAGESFRSLCGVFLYSSSAIFAFSPSRPSPCTSESCRILFMLLTPVSARMLLWGLYAEQILCVTPIDFRNCLVSIAVYCGPPSDVRSSGMPYVVKASLRLACSSSAVPPLLACHMSGHPVKASTISR